MTYGDVHRGRGAGPGPRGAYPPMPVGVRESSGPPPPWAHPEPSPRERSDNRVPWSDEMHDGRPHIIPPPPPPPPRAVEPEEPPEPARSPPPEPLEPSGRVLALTRLMDLEAQMEYAFAKHMQLVAGQKLFRAQYEVLEKAPVGIDAIQEDLDKLLEESKQNDGLYEESV